MPTTTDSFATLPLLILFFLALAASAARALDTRHAWGR